MSLGRDYVPFISLSKLIILKIDKFIKIENLFDQPTWLHNMNKFDSDWQVRYVESFYWSIATFLLVGSKGDSFPETVFCIFILLITVCLFAYILSSIG